MNYFSLRMVAPVATIRGPRIAGNVSQQDVPAPSQVTGMIGAALGIDISERKLLNEVQENIRIAWIVHRRPTVLKDYQTTDLSTPFMADVTYEMDGDKVRICERTGLDTSRTLVSERDLTFDVDMTAIVEWQRDIDWKGDLITVDRIKAAFESPAYHITIGARWALPSEPVRAEIIEATSLDDAVEAIKPETCVYRIYTPIDFGATITGPVVAIDTCDFMTRRSRGSILYAIR